MFVCNNLKIADSINKDLTKSQKDFKALESDYEAMKKKNSESQSSYKSASDWKTKYEKTLKNIVTTAEDVLPKHPKKVCDIVFILKLSLKREFNPALYSLSSICFLVSGINIVQVITNVMMTNSHNSSLYILI